MAGLVVDQALPNQLQIVALLHVIKLRHELVLYLLEGGDVNRLRDLAKILDGSNVIPEVRLDERVLDFHAHVESRVCCLRRKLGGVNLTYGRRRYGNL